MKKQLQLTFLFLFLYNICYAAQPTMSQLRQLFEKSTKEESYCQQMIELLETYNEKMPLFYGYLGSAKVLMAEHSFNPLQKLSYFNDGKQILEKAISVDPNNLELRFLRYSIQNNAPFFLNYNDMLEVDREFLINNMEKVNDPELKNIVTKYLKSVQ